MISLDEDALICDFAEAYRIYDYKSLPLKTVATLACGLGDNSRIYRKMTDCEYSLDTLLLARIYDALQIILYSKTKDAQKGINKPEMMLDRLLGKTNDTSGEYMEFDTMEQFEEFMKKKRGELYG